MKINYGSPSFSGRYILNGTVSDINKFNTKLKQHFQVDSYFERGADIDDVSQAFATIPLSDVYYAYQPFAQELVLTREHCLAHSQEIRKSQLSQDILTLNSGSDLYKNLDMSVEDLDKTIDYIKANRTNNTEILKNLSDYEATKILKYKSAMKARQLLGDNMKKTRHLNASDALKAIEKNSFDFVNGIIR